MSEKLKEVEKMITKVMKKKDLARAAAIDYMLIVATGRLAALWRYDDSLPEGKQTKGILTVVGRKKRAPKTPKIAPPAEASESDLAARKKRAAESKPKRVRKPKPKQLDLAAEAAAE